ncbi:GntR family transcriptional regulator [Nitratireductor aquibiodomus RA22]|uniref:Transcriptional regulator, GntR family n=2 Tax=Nitratireductor aquibiodomus TaxID=204799 RepID=A0A1H4JZS9_9HYPH|nr:GntR family transcriptional regulator [Nitratireductor aquibiodomus]EIM77651.1 GntR family transcriptional regulator [Nitratireductor aquibiodomus RA22]SEB51667.1 transcriptional regulator, GntR family [Nitratireductor aquibiodomus]
MEETDSRSTVEIVATAVTEAVRTGRLVPGQRLTESDFTSRLGVSRSSLREAFRRLTADGLLSAEPHRGVAVRQLSRPEVDNLFQVRGALEALAVKLALPALHRAPASLIDIQHGLDTAAEAGDMNRFSELNARFHRLFRETANNPLLNETLTRLSNSLYWLQFRILVDRQQVFETNRQHQRLTECVKANDASGAEAAMLGHIENARTLIQSLPDDHFAQVSTTRTD